MNTPLTVLLLNVAVGASVLGATAPASAAPPTVQFSPGYDARLAEQRKALAASHQSAPIALPRAHFKRKRHR